MKRYYLTTREFFKADTFRKSETGNATIEAVLWIPFFVFLLMTVAQLGMLFYGQSMTLSLAQEATRAYSVGELATGAEVENYITSRMANVSDGLAISSTVQGATITTVVKIPAGYFGGPLSLFTDFSGLEIAVVAQQTKEL